MKKRTLNRLLLVVVLLLFTFINISVLLPYSIGTMLTTYNYTVVEAPKNATSFRNTALHKLSRLIENQDTLQTRKWILKNSDINIDNREPLLGNSLLMYAIYNNKLLSAEVLLKNGANPNIVNKSMETPLVYALQNNNIPAVKLLLRFGADPSFCPGDSQNTAYAKAANNLECLLLLEDGGLNINDTIVSKTLLTMSVNSDVLYYLICTKRLNALFKYDSLSIYTRYDTLDIYVLDELEKTYGRNSVEGDRLMKEIIKSTVLKHEANVQKN